MPWKIALSILSAAILVISPASPAVSQGSQDPAVSWFFSDQGMPKPQGAIIADSGFRPYPDGFSFLNFGRSLRNNQVLFAQPEPLVDGADPASPVELRPDDMRTMFGPRVCIEGNASGPCELTFSGRAVLDQTIGWATGGRCFGMSNVAAGFYSGLVTSGELATGIVNSFTTLNPTAQRKILRTVTSQYFSATGSPVTSMRELIDMLIADFAQRRISHTILMYGAPGGHGLTPYAVFDRGSGLYDIAVYDSNYPNREFAIQVNTVNNSFTYRGVSRVGDPPILWDSADPVEPATIWIGSVANAVGRQECTFCARSATASLVSFSPVLRENVGILENIKVLDRTGAELDRALYQVVRPMDSVSGLLVNGPVVKVNPGVPFAIAISGEFAKAVEPFTMTITQAGSTRQVRMDSFSEKSSGVVGVGAMARSVSVSGIAFKQIEVSQTIEARGVSYRFSGTQLTGGVTGDLYMRVNEKGKRVFFRDNTGGKSTWRLELRSARDRDTGKWISGVVKLPRGAQIIVGYADFQGRKGQPSAWIDFDSNGTKDRVVKLQRG